MAMVVTQPCIGCKDKSCSQVCPVECFHEGPEMLYIDPESCTECEACIVECPAEAIFHEKDVPEKWRRFISENEKMVKLFPPILE